MSNPGVFGGFSQPKENWSKLPNALIDALPLFTSEAELKVVLYVLRHTWGYHDEDKRISIDEFSRGRKKRGGLRIDTGCGITDNTIKDGLRRAIQHGFIEVAENSRDSGRITRFYRLKMKEVDDESTGSKVDPPDVGGQKLTPVGSEVDPVGSEVDPRSEKETTRKTPPKETGRIPVVTLSLDPVLNLRQVDDGGDAGVFQLRVIRTMLDDLDIAGPKRRAIEAILPKPEFLLAHAIYAVCRGKGAGWIISEVEVSSVPNHQFIEYARLAPDDWRALYLGWSRGEWSTLRPELQGVSLKGRRDFDILFEHEPFTEPEAKHDPSPMIVKPVELLVVPTLSDDERIWLRALGELQLQLTGATYDTWLARTQLRSVESNGDSMKFTIECHNQFAVEWLSNRLNTMITRTLSGIVGKGVGVFFTVKEGK